MILFDKDEKPNFDGLTEDAAWEALNAFEDYIYRIGENEDAVSEEKWDSLWVAYHAAKAELYAKYE